MNKYIGNEKQIYGVEEYRITGGKGDGMRVLNVRNGKGLDFFVSLDRCADISRLTFKGSNMGYFSPCGYVSPKYYEKDGAGFLNSFTAGFFTTCGLTSVGVPCTDDGEELYMHGTISNMPCESVNYYIEDNKIIIKTTVRDAVLFSHKLVLEREYICPLDKNEIYLEDRIINKGSDRCPIEVLYHCNMGYPLLSENAELSFPEGEVAPRDKNAETGIDTRLVMERPQRGYEEQCFYYKFSEKPTVSIFNKDIEKGVAISFDTSELKCFTQWKMMGEYDYVLGLEPGNCYPDGRAVTREKGLLEFLNPDEEKVCNIKFTFLEK